MKKRVPLAIAAVLTACGAVATTSNDAAESAPQAKSKAAQKRPDIGFPDFSRGGTAGCFDPSLSGYARTQAERIGGVPCEQKAGDTETGGTSWVGEYRGPVDGATGVVTITNGRSGLAAEVVMFSDHGCGGSVSGPVTVQADRLVLTKTPTEAEAPQCRIVMTRNGSSLTVQENRCTYYHGRSCEFNGRLTRVGSGAGAKPNANATGQGPVWATDGIASGVRANEDSRVFLQHMCHRQGRARSDQLNIGVGDNLVTDANGMSSDFTAYFDRGIKAAQLRILVAGRPVQTLRFERMITAEADWGFGVSLNQAALAALKKASSYELQVGARAFTFSARGSASAIASTRCQEVFD